MASLFGIGSFAAGLSYPESPRWRDGLLWISDVHHFRLTAFDLGGRLIVEAAVPERPAGTGFAPDGRLLVATALGRRLHWFADGRFELAADLSGMTRGLLNDMVVDSVGRAYVGDTGFNLGAGEPYRPGQIFLFEAGQPPRPVADEVNFPNGMVISPDGATLLVGETFANRITRFTIRPDGSLTDRQVHATLDGTPDGICLDESGALWVATLAGGHFLRIDRDGAPAGRIEVAPAQAVSCMLGGEGRQTLYLCFATVEKDADGVVRREGFVRAVAAPAAGAGLP